MTDIVIFIFHRDLRLVDHYGLDAVLKAFPTSKILPIFIFTPEQVTEKNPVRSTHSIQFMIDSLDDLSNEIHTQKATLKIFYGETIHILKSILKDLKDLKDHKVSGIAETADYTPFAKDRSKKIQSFCKGQSIEYITAHDLYLTNPGSVRTGTGKIYQKFTPYYETARKISIPKPNRSKRFPWIDLKTKMDHEIDLEIAKKRFVPKRNPKVQPGGRQEGLILMRKIPHNYEKIHDLLAEETSRLSPHNHFGTISIREVYWASNNAAFRRQLFWRDFHGALMDNFEALYGVEPYKFEGDRGLRGKTDATAKKVFETWKRGETGHALVDAGIHQLLQTGYMHNRVRLVVASWLVKDKHVYWRWGERFFAQHLVDYDPAQNMMNWINVCSLAPFGMAPFRRHDPEATEKRLDPDGDYLRKWTDS